MSPRDAERAPKHVVVVGAGPGGLAAAMLLAGLGVRVTLLERHAHPGGRMGRVLEGGYALDTGPTILQLPQILEQIFARAGLRMEDFVTLDKVEPNTRVHFWDGTHLDTSTDAAVNRAEWERLVPGGAKSFDAFFATHAEKYRVAYDRFIAHDAHSALAYFNPLRLLPAARFAPWESLYTSLLRDVKDPRIVYAMSYPSKYLGLHPTTCSSVFSVIPFLELAFGVWHPRGGFRALADGMARGIERLGGTIRYGARVRRVVVKDGVARGVELEDGETIDADHVVVNADLAAAKQRMLAPEERPSHGDRAIERHAYSCSTFMLYLGLDKLYADVPHHAIHLSKAVTRTDRDALADRTLDEDDPPFYVCNPCVTDPSGAPAGHSTLYVLVPCPNTANAVDWQTKAAPFAREDHRAARARSASTTWPATSRCSASRPPRRGATTSTCSAARCSTSRTTGCSSARCARGRTIRTWRASTGWAAGRIRAAGSSRSSRAPTSWPRRSRGRRGSPSRPRARRWPSRWGDRRERRVAHPRGRTFSRFIIFCSPKRDRPRSSAARVWLPPVLPSASRTSSASSASTRDAEVEPRAARGRRRRRARCRRRAR